MEIVLFILLVGVWAAFVLPSFLTRRRNTVVNRQSAAADSVVGTAADVRRQQVLARRRLALVALTVLAVGTLVGAVLTGSYLLLGVTLAADVLLAVYIAVLLQIKRNHVKTRYQAAPGPDQVGAASY
jgi:peptidoglycan/LPS O-acetylase OafA/YrhL